MVDSKIQLDFGSYVFQRKKKQNKKTRTVPKFSVTGELVKCYILYRILHQSKVLSFARRSFDIISFTPVYEYIPHSIFYVKEEFHLAKGSSGIF